MNREPESIGEYLRLHVEAKYKSQREAAAAFGCSQCLLSAVLCGHRRPTEAMCEALGVEWRERWVPKAIPQESMPGLPFRPCEPEAEPITLDAWLRGK
jgi:transcriptional regulator with XRE-family HTH domain